MSDRNDGLRASGSYFLGSPGRVSLPRPSVNAVDDAVLLFMEAIEELCPEAIRCLKEDVWPAQRELDEAARKGPIPTYKEWLGLPQQKPYEEALAAWQRRFYLDRWEKRLPGVEDSQKAGGVALGGSPSERFKNLVVTVLLWWTRYGQKEPGEPISIYRPHGKPLSWELAWGSVQSASWTDLLWTIYDKEKSARRYFEQPHPLLDELREAVKPPPLPPYNPLLSRQSWREYLEDVRKEAEAYRERVEAALKAVGANRVREKRNLDHFRWLARYQVCGESYKELSDALDKGKEESNTDEGSVRKAVARTAKLIGLRLRRARE